MEPGERIFLFSFALIGIGLLAYGLGNWSGRDAPQPAATRTHVPSGALDADYAFVPGGGSGDVKVYGLPSGRLLSTIAVFEPSGASGYATQGDATSRKRLDGTGGLRGDLRALARHKTDLYASDKLHGRVARLSLVDFSVREMVRVENLQAPSGLAVVTRQIPHKTPKKPERVATYVTVAGQSSITRSGIVAFLDPTSLKSVFHVSIAGDAGQCTAGPQGKWLFVGASFPLPANPSMALRKSGAVFAIDIARCERDLKRPEIWIGVSGQRKKAGFEITTIHPGTVASSAGLRRNDVITNLEKIRGKQAGAWITLKLQRKVDKKITRLAVQLQLRVPLLSASATTDTSFKGAGDATDEVPIALGREIPVNRQPAGLTLHDPYILVSCRGGNTVTVIDTRRLRDRRPSGAITGEVELGNGPVSSTVGPRGIVYTALYEDSQVVRWDLQRALDGQSDYLLARTRVHSRPTGVTLGDRTVLTFCAQAGEQYLPTGTTPRANMVLLGARDLAQLTQSPVGHAAASALVVPASKLAIRVKREVSSVVTQEPRKPTRSGNQLLVELHISRGRIVPAEFEVKSGDKVTLKIFDIDPIVGIGHGLAVTGHVAGLPIPTGGQRTITFTAGAPGTYYYYETRAASISANQTRGLMVVKKR